MSWLLNKVPYKNENWVSCAQNPWKMPDSEAAAHFLRSEDRGRGLLMEAGYRDGPEWVSSRLTERPRPCVLAGFVGQLDTSWSCHRERSLN